MFALLLLILFGVVVLRFVLRVFFPCYRIWKGKFCQIFGGVIYFYLVGESIPFKGVSIRRIELYFVVEERDSDWKRSNWSNYWSIGEIAFADSLEWSYWRFQLSRLSPSLKPSKSNIPIAEPHRFETVVWQQQEGPVCCGGFWFSTSLCVCSQAISAAARSREERIVVGAWGDYKVVQRRILGGKRIKILERLVVSLVCD